MNDNDRLNAIEDIRLAKARYIRGTDTGDAALVRAHLAEDCVLDFRECWTDPATGKDYLPEINVVMKGAASWSPEGFSELGVVSEHTSAHHVYSHEITFQSDTVADAIWALTDRLFMPADSEYDQLTGYGYYVETYEKVGGQWKLKTMRIRRLRAEGE